MPGDPLPSWAETEIKSSILEFVRTVADEAHPDHVPVAERVAVFDKYGTLWPEQPLYIQLAFAVDRVKALAPQHPEWRTNQPFKGLLEGDSGPLAAGGLTMTRATRWSPSRSSSGGDRSSPPGTPTATSRC